MVICDPDDRLSGQCCGLRLGSDIVRVGFEPVVGPGRNRVHDGVERGALVGEVVFDSDRRTGEHLAVNDSFGLEFLEALGKKSIMQSRHGVADIGKAVAPAAHRPENGSVPALANQLDRFMEGRAKGGNVRFVFHNAHSRWLWWRAQDAIGLALDDSQSLTYSKRHTNREHGSTGSIRQKEIKQMATWQIDQSHTNVEFSVKHMMVSSTKGRFSGVSGEIEYDPTNVGASSVNVSIDVATIDTRDEKRDAHLRSADFFDAEQFPTMSFVSTSVKPTGGDDFEIVGNLTIKDVTREVTLKAEAGGVGTSPWGFQVAGFSASTSIDRKDYGLTWNVALEAGGFVVGDKIKISLEVEATQQPVAEAAPVDAEAVAV